MKTLYGDARHDDTKALQALIDGEQVMFKGFVIGNKSNLGSHTFRITEPLVVRSAKLPFKGAIIKSSKKKR